MRQSQFQVLYRIVLTALALLTVWLALKYLLPWTAPFIIAFALAALMEPSVKRMSRGILTRSVASGLCTILLFGALLSFLAFVGVRGAAELSGAAARTPEILDGVMSALERLELWARDAADALPAGLGRFITSLIDAIPDQFSTFPAWISGKLLELLSVFAEKMPSALLFIATTGIGVYFFSASYPTVLRFIARQIPEKHKPLVKFLRTDLLHTIACWLRAQLILMALTFGELLVAFALLRVDYALVMALLTAIIDALPVLGTGTVLIPWALAAFFTGRRGLALGLVIAYAAITLLRNLIQAKLLGDSLGLHPVVTLIAIYVGFCVMGIWGMILFPVLAITLKQLNDNEFIHLWKREDPPV